MRRKEYASCSARPSSRPTYPRSVSRANALSVVGGRTSSSARPCTIWSSWTANSTSRSPPEPSFSCRSAVSAGMCSITRRRIACTSSTNPSRSAADHTSGPISSTYSRPSVEVPGHRTGLQQRLELPRLGPPVVVAAVAGERAHERTGLALGTQVGVDRPDGALGGVVRADLHHRRGELGRGPHGRIDARHALRGLGHEDDVDVADVVQLVPSALAHRDHGQAAAVRGLADLGAGHRQSGVERAGGEVGELRRHVVDAEVVGQVAGGEPQEQPSVLHPQRVLRRRVLEGRHGSLVSGVGTHGSQQPGPHDVRRRAGRPDRRVGELVPLLGVPAQVLPQRLARAEHREQTHRGALVVGHLLEQLVAVLDDVGDGDQCSQGEVGVGTAPDRRRPAVGRPHRGPRGSPGRVAGSKKPRRTRLPWVMSTLATRRTYRHAGARVAQADGPGDRRGP